VVIEQFARIYACIMGVSVACCIRCVVELHAVCCDLSGAASASCASELDQIFFLRRKYGVLSRAYHLARLRARTDLWKGSIRLLGK
jgi:hypothetical protein